MSINHFSGSAQKSAAQFASARTRYLSPVLSLLTLAGVKPNILTAASVIVVSGYLYFLPTNTLLAMSFVGASVLIDGIDGALARFQNRVTKFGAVLDSLADHAVFSIVMLGLIGNGMINPLWGALYLLAYNTMIILVVVLNAMQRPLRFFIPTKYIFFLAILINAYVLPGVLDIVVAVSAVLALLTLGAIVRKLKNIL